MKIQDIPAAPPTEDVGLNTGNVTSWQKVVLSVALKNPQPGLDYPNRAGGSATPPGGA